MRPLNSARMFPIVLTAAIAIVGSPPLSSGY